MSSAGASVWNLFVDESGDFDEPDDDVTVAAVLVRADLPGTRAPELRQALRDAVPYLPWPFHASVQNQPTYLALALAVHLEGGGAAPAWQAILAGETVAALRAVEPTRLAGALEAFRAGRAPDYAVVAALGQALRAADPALHRALGDLRLELRDRLAALLDALVARAEAVGGAPVAFVSSGEPSRGECAPDRYFDHLDCLLERTRDLLLHRGGRHHVWLHVLGRHVDEPTLGRRTPLHVRHLGPIARRLTVTEVRLVPATVPAYGPAVHPLLVVADLAANRARSALRHDQPLRRVEGELSASLRLPVRSGAPPLSHAAAVGPPRAVVAGTTPPADLSPRHRRWSVEQAVEWAACRGGAR